MTLSGVDGGPGGVGALEIRFSVGYGSAPLEVRLDGALAATVTLDPTGNS